jgi:hypothetical protein
VSDPKPEQHRTIFTIDADLQDRLRKVADREHRSISGQLRLIVSQYLDADEASASTRPAA